MRTLTRTIQRRYNLQRNDARRIITTNLRRGRYVPESLFVTFFGAGLATFIVLGLLGILETLGVPSIESSTTIGVPLESLLAIAAVVAATITVYTVARGQFLLTDLADRARADRCISCNYDLRGLPATPLHPPHRTCPECGTPNPPPAGRPG